MIREALRRLTDDRLPEDTNAIGGYWTRANAPEIDLAGADRSPIAKKITPATHLAFERRPRSETWAFFAVQASRSPRAIRAPQAP